MTHHDREKLLYRYSQLLAQGDLDGIQAILTMAETDPILDQMIAELDQAWLDEAKPTLMDSMPSTHSQNHNHRAPQIEVQPMTTMTKTLPFPIDEKQSEQKSYRIPMTLVAAVVITVLFGIFLLRQPTPPETALTPIVALQIEENERLEILSRYVDDIWNADNPDALSELITDDHIFRADELVIEGNESYRLLLQTFHSQLPEVSFAVNETSVDGDTITASIAVTYPLPVNIDHDAIRLPDTLEFAVMMIVNFRESQIAETTLMIDEDAIFASLVEEFPLLGTLELDFGTLINFSLADLGLGLPILDGGNDSEGSEIILPELPECEGDILDGLQTDSLQADVGNAEQATFLFYAPFSNADIMSLNSPSDSLIEGELDYIGSYVFDVTGDLEKTIQFLQNPNCNGFTVTDMNVFLNPDIPLTTQIVVTTGNVDADLSDLTLVSGDFEVITGNLDVIYPTTTNAIDTFVDVTSGNLDFTFPDDAIMGDTRFHVASGNADISVGAGATGEITSTIASGFLTLTMDNALGVRVNVNIQGMGQLELPRDYEQAGDNVWQSPNFDSAESQVIINLSITTGVVEIR